MNIFGFLISTIVIFIVLEHIQCTDIKEKILKNGYPFERHSVTTEDGYILSIFRIRGGRNSTKTSSKPVLVHPGILTAPDSFIALGPKQGLGFILADKGYDVWMLSPRGTTYSKRHKYIDVKTNQKAFFNFSWHEIGVYDNPATVDYILKQTSKKKLFYICHSQGCATFVVMTSVRPEYNKKIRLASLMAPAVFLEDVHPVLKLAAPFAELFGDVTDSLGIYHIPFIGCIRAALNCFCRKEINHGICTILYGISAGYPDSDQVDPAIFSTIFHYIPSDAAVKQFLHFSQIINVNGHFQQYDYGPVENVERYHSMTPPAYTLNKVTCPVAIYVGKNDQYAGPTNSERLKRNLKNVVHYSVVKNSGWDHADFLYGTDVVKLVYNHVLNLMKSY